MNDSLRAHEIDGARAYRVRARSGARRRALGAGARTYGCVYTHLGITCVAVLLVCCLSACLTGVVSLCFAHRMPPARRHRQLAEMRLSRQLHHTDGLLHGAPPTTRRVAAVDITHSAFTRRSRAAKSLLQYAQRAVVGKELTSVSIVHGIAQDERSLQRHECGQVYWSGSAIAIDFH